MPTHFRPAPGPRQLPDGVVPDPKHSPRRLSVAASFLTDAALLERHLPEGFALAGEPVVTVEFHYMTGVDWLAGRGYTMIDVGWPATFMAARTRRAADSSPSSGRTLPIRSSRDGARSAIPSYMPRSPNRVSGMARKYARPAGWAFASSI